MQLIAKEAASKAAQAVPKVLDKSAQNMSTFARSAPASHQGFDMPPESAKSEDVQQTTKSKGKDTSVPGSARRHA